MRRLVVILVAIVSLNMMADAQKTGCVSGKCKTGEGEYHYENGDIYKGNFVDKKREGKGTLIYSGVGQYVGQWKNDKKNGLGKDSISGDVYEGNFVDGKKQGQGKITFFSGGSFDGEWNNDQMYKGKYVTMDGDTFEGQLTPDGNYVKGKLTYANGESFDGTFENNEPVEGIMTKTLSNGYKYSGGWKEGKMNGKGTLIINETTTYEGNFINNVMQGSGKLTDSRGIYEGQFNENKKNGTGKMTYKNGWIYEGDWVNDKWEGKGKLTVVSRSGKVIGTYEGPVRNNKRETKAGETAKFIYTNGKVYEGPFHNNKAETLEGETGSWTFKSGKKIVGQFKDNRPNGKCTLIDKAGNKYSGSFLKGKLQDGPITVTKANGKVLPAEIKAGKITFK